jgi:hypothetical protein
MRGFDKSKNFNSKTESIDKSMISAEARGEGKRLIRKTPKMQNFSIKIEQKPSVKKG